MLIAHEISLGGVYVPPLLIASIAGLIATLYSARLMDRYRISRHFISPPLVLLCMCVIYTLVIGELLIGI